MKFVSTVVSFDMEMLVMPIPYSLQCSYVTECVYYHMLIFINSQALSMIKSQKFVGFKYTKSVQVTESITVPSSAYGCSCRGQCTDPKSCSCAQLNGSDFPYVCIDGGRWVVITLLI